MQNTLGVHGTGGGGGLLSLFVLVAVGGFGGFGRYGRIENKSRSGPASLHLPGFGLWLRMTWLAGQNPAGGPYLQFG